MSTARLVRSVLAALVMCAACGGKAGSDGGGGVGPGRDVMPLDQTFTSYDEIALSGLHFEPEALGRPGMVRVSGPRRNTLVRQRKRVRSGGNRTDVHVLVTMLWDAASAVACCRACAEGQQPCGESCVAPGERCTSTGGCACSAADAPKRREQELELRGEALRELRTLADSAGAKKLDAVSLQMLGTAGMWLDQAAVAEAAYRQLIERFPERADRANSQTWLVMSMLRGRRVAEAAALVDGWKPADVDPIGAYVLAWVRLSQRDFAAARAAIVEAARRWSGPGAAAVERDLLLILARGGVDAAEAAEDIAAIAGGDLARQRRMVHRLAEAYHFAGYYDRAYAALDLLLGALAAGDAVTPRDRVAYRLQQADFQLRVGNPKRSAELIIESHRGLEACAAACAGELAAQVETILLKLAVFFHNTYHDSLDDQFYAAAEALYGYLLKVPGRRDGEEQRAKLANLQDTRASANPSDGKHGEQVLYQLAVLRAEAVKACYEGVLLVEPQLVGTLVLRLEIDQSGAVIGAASEPPHGMEGIPAAASCALEHARSWRFPARTVPGKTTTAFTYVLQPANLRRPAGSPP